MPTQPRTTDSEHARLQNDYGADYWVRNSAQEHRRATAGRGLFAGLQDVKHYNVDHGWARRKSETPQPGILGSLWSRLTGLWYDLDINCYLLDGYRVTGCPVQNRCLTRLCC